MPDPSLPLSTSILHLKEPGSRSVQLSPLCPVTNTDATGKSHVKMFLRTHRAADGLQHHLLLGGLGIFEVGCPCLSGISLLTK